ncbi:cellular morphogenesis protein [Moniliophthora roreri]|nr:cellular morphogenesis protein [Moniliophthora roreri]
MLARAVLLARSRAQSSPATSAISRRNASSHSNDDHHHTEEHDETVYTKEGFTSPAWRNGLLVTALALAAYQYAPEPTEDAYLTRWLQMYTTSSGKWLDMNARHTAQSKDSADTTELFNAGAQPPVHRLRFPQLLDQASPFLNGVGMNVDMSSVKVKKEGEFA